MNLEPTKHSKDSLTHYACSEQILKDGGCCACSGHKCEINEIIPMKKIMKVTITLESIGSDKEWFYVIDFKDGSREQGWLIGRQTMVSDVIKTLMS